MAADWTTWGFDAGCSGFNTGEADFTAAAGAWNSARGTNLNPDPAFPTNNDVRNRIILTGGGTLAMAGADSGRFYAANVVIGGYPLGADWTEAWHENCTGPIRCCAVTDGVNVGWGDDGGHFRVRVNGTGAVVWDEVNASRVRGAPVLSGANVIWLDQAGVLRARNFTTGAVVWTTATGLTSLESNLLIVGANVYGAFLSGATAQVRAYTTAGGVFTHAFQTAGSDIGPIATAALAGLTILSAPCDDHYIYSWNAASPFGYVWTNLGGGDAATCGVAFDPVDDRMASHEHNSSSQLWIMGTGHMRAKEDSANTAGNPLALDSTPCIAGTNVAGQQVMAQAMSAGDRRVKIRSMISAPGGWTPITRFPTVADAKNPFDHSSPIISNGILLIGGEGSNQYGAGFYAFG